MNQRLLSFMLALAVVCLFTQAAYSQVQFQIPITVAAGTTSATLNIGVSGDGPAGSILDNTVGMDTAMTYGSYREVPAAPAPPAPFDFDTRIVTIPGRVSTFPTGLAGGVNNDFRGFVSTSQVDSFKITIAGDFTDNGSTTVSWPNNLNQYGTTWTIKPQTGTDWPSTNMITSTSVVIPAGAHKNIIIIKTGLLVTVAGPTFDLSSSSLGFGTVTIPGNAQRTVTVTNSGSTNALSITGVASIANYTVSPSSFPISVAPGANQVFTLTFTPSAPGTFAGNVVFTHNAPSSPTNLAVTGVGTNAPTQGGVFQFSASPIRRFDNTQYEDSLRLVGYVGQPLKALQFRVIMNGLLRLRTIERGSSVPSASYGFDYTLVRGPVAANGESNDTIKALIYGLGSNALPAGTYNNMMKFTYDAVNISADSLPTSITLDRVFSSLATGADAQVSSAGNQSVMVVNRALRGDVNGDDRVDILDLLDVVDHIVERNLLTGRGFTAADVAPWPAGDGVVNVQDLAVLQNIILTGLYPDGTPTGSAVRSNGGTIIASYKNGSTNGTNGTVDAKLTFHITAQGIAVRMQNNVPVKGMQLEFSEVPVAPPSIDITTILGGGYSNYAEALLRVLLYSQQGTAVVEPGDRLVANIPFGIADPQSIELGRYIIAGADNKGLSKIEIQISYDSAPELPIDYALFQNYPNPFNPSTTVRFSVPVTGQVKVSIYNTLGQEVRTLYDNVTERGTKEVRFDGKDKNGITLSTGMYLYRMTAGSFVQSKKMMFLK